MAFILNHQYELLYSFGAFFAFFSMLSYVSPVIKKEIDIVGTSMGSSEQFFEGFEGPDLDSILTADISDDEPFGADEVLSFKEGGGGES